MGNACYEPRSTPGFRNCPALLHHGYPCCCPSKTNGSICLFLYIGGPFCECACNKDSYFFGAHRRASDSFKLPSICILYTWALRGVTISLLCGLCTCHKATWSLWVRNWGPKGHASRRIPHPGSVGPNENGLRKVGFVGCPSDYLDFRAPATKEPPSYTWLGAAILTSISSAISIGDSSARRNPGRGGKMLKYEGLTAQKPYPSWIVDIGTYLEMQSTQ